MTCRPVVRPFALFPTALVVASGVLACQITAAVDAAWGHQQPARQSGQETDESRQARLDLYRKQLSDSEDPVTRAAAIGQLARLGALAEPALPALIETLADDPEVAVRAAAAEAVAEIGRNQPAAQAALLAAFMDSGELESNEPIWGVAARVLAKFDDRILPEVKKRLTSGSYRQARAACVTVHHLGTRAQELVGDVASLLAQQDPLTQQEAVYALIGLGPLAQPAVPQLIKTLDAESFHIQYWTCQALGKIGPGAEPAAKKLGELAMDGVTSVRRHAVAALGDIGPVIGSDGIRIVAEALDDPNQMVREQAIRALPKLGPAAQVAAPRLEQGLQRRSLADRALAARAHWAITNTVDVALPVLRESLKDIDEDWLAAQTLAEMGPLAKPAVNDLLELAGSPNALTRLNVALALGEIGEKNDKVLAALTTLSEDDDEQVRQVAASSLARLK